MNVTIVLFLCCILTSKVFGTCELTSRIKLNDSEVIVSQTDQPCALTLTARNNKQVVVVIYDMVTDCVEKAAVAIYDGHSLDGKFITDLCWALPWSLASRTHNLTLVPVPGRPLRQFSLDIHAIATTEIYLNATGIIRSQRYFGGISSVRETNTTPNNFHGIYKIIVVTDVSVLLTFQEFRIRQSASFGCEDYIQITTKSSVSDKLCGDHVLPKPFSRVTKNLTIELFTDHQFTYTGFTAQYKVCLREVNNRTGIIDFQTYPYNDNMTCVYIINVRERSRIKLSLTFVGGGSCKDIFKISFSGNTSVPMDCTSDNEYSGSLATSRDVILKFTFKSGQHIFGNFLKEYISGINKSNSGNNEGDAPPVVIATTITISLLVVLTIILIVLYKKRKINILLFKHKRQEYEPSLHPVTEASYSQPVQVHDEGKVNSDTYENEKSTENQEAYYNVETSAQYEDVVNNSNYEDPITVTASNNEHQYADLTR